MYARIVWSLYYPYIALAVVLLLVILSTTWLIVRLIRKRRRWRGVMKLLCQHKAFERTRMLAHPGGFWSWSVYKRRPVWGGTWQGRRVEISWTKESEGDFFEYRLEAENPISFFLSGLFGTQTHGRKSLDLLGRELLFYCDEQQEERIRTLLESEELAEMVLEIQWLLIARVNSGFVFFGDPEGLDCWKGLAVRQKSISVGECPPQILVGRPDDFDPDRVVEIFDRLLDIHERLGRVHAAWE